MTTLSNGSSLKPRYQQSIEGSTDSILWLPCLTGVRSNLGISSRAKGVRTQSRDSFNHSTVLFNVSAFKPRYRQWSGGGRGEGSTESITAVRSILGSIIFAQLLVSVYNLLTRAGFS